MTSLFGKVLLLCLLGLTLSQNNGEENRPRPNPVKEAARRANQESKRQLAGGWVTREHDKGVTEAANFATAELSKKSNSLFHDKVVEIVSAKSQVVAGTKYEIVFRMGRTQCKKNQIKLEEIETCEIDESHPASVCTVQVWTQPWLNKIELLESQCVEEQRETGPVIPDDVYEVERIPKVPKPKE